MIQASLETGGVTGIGAKSGGTSELPFIPSS